MNFNDMLEKQLTALSGFGIGSEYSDRNILELPNRNILVSGENGRWELFGSGMISIKSGTWVHGTPSPIRTSIVLNDGGILLAGDNGHWAKYDTDMNDIISGRWVAGSEYSIHTSSILTNGNLFLAGGSGRYEIRKPDGVTHIKGGTWSSGAVSIFNSAPLSNGHILLTGASGWYKVFDPISVTEVRRGKALIESNIYDSIVLLNEDILLVGASGRWELFNKDMSISRKSGTWAHGMIHIYGSTIIQNKYILLVGMNGRWQIFDLNMNAINNGQWMFINYIFDCMRTSTGKIILGGAGGRVAVYSTNTIPNVVDNTESNKVFYEGDTITLNGSVKDLDNGNIMSVKYKVNNGTTRAIATGISDGTTPLNYSKILKYTMGTLKDGNAVIATGLVDGQSYKITIWAEDDQGGKSTEVVRSFTVVPNRPPVLSIDPITSQTNKINSEKITISGNVTDADGNDVIVDVKVNNNASTRVYIGAPSNFNFDIKIADLIEGENTITVTSKDTFDFTTTKVIRLNKARNAVPLKTAIVRYKVNPPTGSAKEILAWIQKEVGDLTIDADVSMVLQGEIESYVAMNKLTAPINDTLEEDEFTYQALEEKDSITLKLKMTKLSELSTESVKQISGVLG